MREFFVRKINNYIDLLGYILNNNEFATYTTSSTKYLMKNNYTKKDYFRLKSMIINEMIQYCMKIKDLEALIIALFAFRSSSKIQMYSVDMERYTIQYKICNKVCCFAYKVFIENGKYTDDMSEFEKVQHILNLAYIYYVNMDRYNKFLLQKYEENSVEKFQKRLVDVSKLHEDMHTYCIKNNDIKFYLESNKLDEKTFYQNQKKYLKNRYISEIQLDLDIPSMNVLLNSNQSDKKDDIIIIDKASYDRIRNTNYKGFIEYFSINRHYELEKEETEIAFAYFGKDENVYISKKLMSVAQGIISSFLKWCQYTKLISFYYDFEKIKENKNYYNKIMTYKIADLLIDNKYVLPIEKKTVEGKKIIIPRIEINKIVKGEPMHKLGDYDVIFYSPFTRTLYNLEYKNYQMMITEEGCFANDIKKVESDDVIKKSLEREKYLNNHLPDLENNIFNGQKIIIEKVKTIIMTTKPNLYFYVNNPNDYLYFEWIEFKDIIEKCNL